VVPATRFFISLLLYSISIITNNIIIIVDYKDDIHYLKLLNMKYKPNYILIPKKKSKIALPTGEIFILCFGLIKRIK